MNIHPVIHINSVAQATEQAAVAVDAGATSVFLIDHRGAGLLWPSVAAVRDRFAGLRIGVNDLGGSAARSVAALSAAVAGGAGPVHMLWCDDARDGRTDVDGARRVAELLAADPQLADVEYFGGAAFKYTASYTDDPAAAAAEVRLLAPFVAVPTTSGPGTNFAADAAKVAAMRAELGAGGRLALASGVSPENLGEYVGHVTDVLVASSLETEPYSGLFIPARVAALFAAVADLT